MMFLLLLLACGEAAPPPPPPPPERPSAELTARTPSRLALSGLWGEVLLPIDGGEVVYGNDLVVIRWTGSARQHHDAFANALVARGFSKSKDLSNSEQKIELYSRGARDVMLSVSDDTVTVQDFGASESP